MANEIDGSKPGAPEKDEVDPEYRQWLVAAEQKAQEDYDKTVIALSGGALGISFAFVKDIIGDGAIQHSGWLVLAWTLWALSVSAVLSSFFVSRLALRKAILQCDEGTIFCQPPGGFYTKLIRVFNVSGSVLFFAGVLFMAAFVNMNLTNREIRNEGQKTTQPSAPESAAASAKNGSQRGSQSAQ